MAAVKKVGQKNGEVGLLLEYLFCGHTARTFFPRAFDARHTFRARSKSKSVRTRVCEQEEDQQSFQTVTTLSWT